MEYKRRVFYAIGFTLFWLAFGTVVFEGLEGWTWIDSLYFSASTITTVGYGDLVTHTMPGRLFNIFYMLIGVGAALYTFTIVAEHYFETHNPVLQMKLSERMTSLREKRKLRKMAFYEGLVGEKGDDKRK